MTLAEANRIVDRLASGCNVQRFDESGVREEYLKKLIKYGFAQMNAAVDTLLETDSQYVPAISALIKTYKDNKPDPEQVKNTEHCDICNDKGYVPMTEIEKISDRLNIPRQYVLHCICPVGMAQAYEGRECKGERKSNYRVPSVAEYFDDRALEEMKRANRTANKPLTVGDIAIMKEQFARIGFKMPELKTFEIEEEHGDAWEGEPCPF